MIHENDETFFVNLSNAQGLTIVDGQGVGTIANDDGPPALSVAIADKAITEGDVGGKTLTMTLTVSLSATTSQPVTVSYATAEAGGLGSRRRMSTMWRTPGS